MSIQGDLNLNQSQYKTSRSSLNLPNFTGGSSKFSQIATPSTLILKTLGSIEFTTRPRKSKVGVGGNGSDNGGHSDGGNCSSNSNRNLFDSPKSMYLFASLITKLRTSASINSSASTTQIVVVFDGVHRNGSCSDNFDKKIRFLRIQLDRSISHLAAQDKLINKLIN